jgi:hypothetical protein
MALRGNSIKYRTKGILNPPSPPEADIVGEARNKEYWTIKERECSLKEFKIDQFTLKLHGGKGNKD